jgi:D,D-heptose 1,7-bisphosphate phosphatase
MFQSVILAGGEGTRLKNIFPTTPKSLVYIGNKPVIEHQIISLKQLSDIFIVTNSDYQNKFIHYIHDACLIFEKCRMGTATGLYQVRKEMKDDFILSYGDIIYDLDWRRVMSFHKKHNKICTIVLHPTDHICDSDLVSVNKNNLVTNLYKKPHTFNANLQNLGITGLFIFSPKIFNYLNPYSKQDLVQDIIPLLIQKRQVCGFKTTEYIKDMGTPDRLVSVRNDYQKGTIARRNIRQERPTIFLDRDGNINKNKGFIKSNKDFTLLPLVAEAIKIINKNNYYAIVVTNQSAIARNICTTSCLKRIHNKMEWELGRYGAYLDAIYYCPHHPDSGYPEERKEYKIDCSCRKPKIGMIEQACQDFRIDMSQSYMIGDSETDRTTARNAGIRFINNNNEDLLSCVKLIFDLMGDVKVDPTLENIRMGV